VLVFNARCIGNNHNGVLAAVNNQFNRGKRAMVKRITSPHELIQNLIDGENGARTRRRLVAMGGSAVRPLLEALVGNQGQLRGALPELVDILERIAKKDVNLLIAALKDHPALNIVVWAVGHGAVKRRTLDRRAHHALKRHRKHKDGGIRAVANHHLERIEKGTGRKRKSNGEAVKKRPAKKGVKTVSKRESTAKKKATTKRAGVKKTRQKPSSTKPTRRKTSKRRR
jgi:hypothetical protein